MPTSTSRLANSAKSNHNSKVLGLPNMRRFLFRIISSCLTKVVLHRFCYFLRWLFHFLGEEGRLGIVVLSVIIFSCPSSSFFESRLVSRAIIEVNRDIDRQEAALIEKVIGFHKRNSLCSWFLDFHSPTHLLSLHDKW